METISNFFAQLTQYGDVGLFLMRLLVGGLFTYSGSRKIRKYKSFAKGNGLPAAIGFLVALAELTGGVGLISGIFTQLAALFIMIVMAGAMYHHIVKWKSPYWAQSKGWEYDLMWFTMSLVILLSGGGAIALYPGF